MSRTSAPLSSLRNFGPITASWMKEIGVVTSSDLEAIGIEDAFRRLVLRGINVNALMLYAMEGALTDTHWNEIGEHRKKELRALASEIKKQCKL